MLVLDEIEKPGNLGAILRTAEAMGVDAIILSESKVDFSIPMWLDPQWDYLPKKMSLRGRKLKLLNG